MDSQILWDFLIYLSGWVICRNIKESKWMRCKLVWQLMVCGKFSHFFVSKLGKFRHWPKPLTCPKPSKHVRIFSPVEKGSMVMGDLQLHVWRRKLVESESDTCDQKPWKPCNFTNCVTQLQSHLCQHQSDLLFCFWGNCVNLHLCVCNITCTICAHTKKSRLSCSCPKFVTQKKKHCFCMALVLSLHGWCNL